MVPLEIPIAALFALGGACSPAKPLQLVLHIYGFFLLHSVLGEEDQVRIKLPHVGVGLRSKIA